MRFMEESRFPLNLMLWIDRSHDGRDKIFAAEVFDGQPSAGVIACIRRMFSSMTPLFVPQRRFSIVTSAMPNGPSRMRITSPVMMFFTSESSSSGIGSRRSRSISL